MLRRVYTFRRYGQCLAGVFALWLGCASPDTTGAHENPNSNWTSAHVPCAKYDDLRNDVLGNVGVKIDTTEAWSDAFRQAFGFWNNVLAVNFYEEANLETCAVRIINGGPDILNKVTVGRAQITEWDNFRGKIAVSPGAAKTMSSAEIYGAAVHELGHLLGLKHNSNAHSLMYFLNLDGTEALDRNDISELSTHHRLRPGIVAGPPPLNVFPRAVSAPMLSGEFSPATGETSELFTPTFVSSKSLR